MACGGESLHSPALLNAEYSVPWEAGQGSLEEAGGPAVQGGFCCPEQHREMDSGSQLPTVYCLSRVTSSLSTTSFKWRHLQGEEQMNRCCMRRNWKHVTKKGGCAQTGSSNACGPWCWRGRCWLDQAGTGFLGAARGIHVQGSIALHLAGG